MLSMYHCTFTGSEIIKKKLEIRDPLMLLLILASLDSLT